ncbi:unnamed protein product, partial [Didymodactylos carnosus]
IVKKNADQQTTINLDDIDSKLLVNILQPVLNARLEKRLCDIKERLKQIERDIADAGKRIHLNLVNSIDTISYQPQTFDPAQTDSTCSQPGMMSHNSNITGAHGNLQISLFNVRNALRAFATNSNSALIAIVDPWLTRTTVE